MLRVEHRVLRPSRARPRFRRDGGPARAASSARWREELIGGLDRVESPPVSRAPGWAWPPTAAGVGLEETFGALRRSRRWHARGPAGYHRRYTQVSAVVCPNVYTRATAMWSLPAALEGAGGITADTPGRPTGVSQQHIQQGDRHASAAGGRPGSETRGGGGAWVAYGLCKIRLPIWDPYGCLE